MTDFFDLDLDEATGAGDLLPALEHLRWKFGFDHVSYACLTGGDGGIAHYVSTYPTAWVERYFGAGFERVDPVLRVAGRSVLPVHWGRLEACPTFRPFFDTAQLYGISDCGVTFPVRGVFGDTGLLSVSANMPRVEWAAFFRPLVPVIYEAAAGLHDAYLRATATQVSGRATTLSEREREMLQWTAAGKTQQDIADILCISHRTVETHLRAVRMKLSALTTAHAVSRAIAMRLIASV